MDSLEIKRAVEAMETSIKSCLSVLENGYSMRKWAIAKYTGIPEDILTPLLKRLKTKGEVEIMMNWSEETCRPDGSGYCLKINS